MGEDRFAGRRQRIIEKIREQNLDAAWITGLCNVRYLTGFTGSYGQLLLSRDEQIFVTDGRYREQSSLEVQGCQIHILQNTSFPLLLSEFICEKGWKQIGYEANHLTCESLDKQAALNDTTSWEPLAGWVENLRRVKDETEIRLLEDSSKIIDQVYPKLLEEIREGVTERQILQRLMCLLWDCGAKGPSFDPIILFGARTSLPHGQPSDCPLQKNSWVLIDFGADYCGYCSDCTRTFFYGEPGELERERHHLVMRAYQEALNQARAGAECAKVDAAAREVLAHAGLGEAFMHGLGHGVGVEIHEAPRLGPTSTDTLEAGMVVTIEPGIYLAGWGGIRLENAVVITRDGARPLTSCDMSIEPYRFA